MQRSRWGALVLAVVGTAGTIGGMVFAKEWFNYTPIIAAAREEAIQRSVGVGTAATLGNLSGERNWEAQFRSMAVRDLDKCTPHVERRSLTEAEVDFIGAGGSGSTVHIRVVKQPDGWHGL